LNAETKRHGRIKTLYKLADSGFYTWKDLREKARSMGVSETTVTSYLRTVEAQLRKAGRIK